MQNRWTPLAIFPKTLDPPRNFGKNIPYPLPWIFNPCASMIVIENNFNNCTLSELLSQDYCVKD